MKIDLYDQKGKKGTTKVEVSDSLVANTVSDQILAQYVYVYLSNQRAPIAHAKDRSEVSGGGRKPWRQKGTGRARHGSNRSPIWTGGGVTFGPTNLRNWKKKLNKQVKIKALTGALSRLVAADKLRIVSDINFKDEKLTKQATDLLKAFGSPRKVIIVTADSRPEIINAFSNIENAKVIRVGELNAYEVINAGEMIVLQDALEFMNKWA